MKTRVRDLIEQGDKLFSQRYPMLSLWQTTADNFYPQRADFTTQRSLGAEFAANLMTGVPVLAHRDLSNQLSAMLRPRGQSWFKARTDREEINEDSGARAWLDHVSDIQLRVMTDNLSGFVRATKEGDADFAAFGQCVIRVRLNRERNGLLYRAKHLRDVAWCENAELQIDHVHENWQPAVRDIVRLFPDTAAPKIREALDKEPHRLVKCRQVMIPADEYDLATPQGRRKLPFVSLVIDTENDVILEEVPAKRIDYVIPRWQTVSGSQYAYSPATVIALPDARLLQQITLTLLEAGQKAVDPPLVATGEAIQGAVNTYAGGVTTVDAEYDEKMGEALRALNLDFSHLQWGVEREEKIERIIKEAFYLNTLRMPDIQGGEKMTAYEAARRNEEYIRSATPLFEPMEVEYNGGICDISFSLIQENGGFGSPYDMPPILRGADVSFQFQSPIQGAAKRANTQAFMTSAQLLQIAAAMDPASVHAFDVDTALRDALEGADAPAKWIVSPEKAAAAVQATAEAQQAQAAAAQLQQGSEIAGNVGDAVGKAGKGVAALQAAGVIPGQAPASVQPQG